MLLDELLSIIDSKSLQEAKNVEPLEVKDAVKKSTKRLDLQNLTYKGQSFFTSSGFGPVYSGAIKAAEDLIKKIKIPLDVIRPDDGSTEELDFKLEVNPQECYLGYSPASDDLYIGFDCVIDVSETWDKWCDDEGFDDSDRKIEIGLNKSWKEISKKTAFGILLKLKTTDGKTFKAEDIDSVDGVGGGFYRTCYKSPAFKRLKLVDLRLD